MKRIFYTLTLLLVLSLPAQAQRRQIAIFDPLLKGNVNKILIDIVREEISTVIVKRYRYIVLERELIESVLDENRFQESGLVNNEQISDIGYFLGADYVIISTISDIDRYYHISCKMIEVETARVVRQYTATTTYDIDDIIATTQFVVRRMFGENVKQPAARTERPVQPYTQRSETAPNRMPSNYRPLYADRMNVFSSGRVLTYGEARSIMAHTDAYKYYNRGLRTRAWGNWLSTLGCIALGVGLYAEVAAAQESDEYRGFGIAAGAAGFFTLAIPGFAMKSAAKRKVRKAVDIYNYYYGYSEPTPSLKIDFGITSSGGIGFVMKF